MSNDKRTKEKLEKAAMKEFMEKGFMKASLRNICKNAGVTTGALYFFFQDKEDLFASLVKRPVEQVLQMVNDHMEEEEHEMEMIQKSMGLHQHDFVELDRLVDVLYDNFDGIYLVLRRSEGSRYYGVENQIISMCEKHGKRVIDSYTEAFHTKSISDAWIHWLAHDIVGIFVYMIEHKLEKDESKEMIRQATLYIFGGMMSIIKGIQE